MVHNIIHPSLSMHSTTIITSRLSAVQKLNPKLTQLKSSIQRFSLRFFNKIFIKFSQFVQFSFFSGSVCIITMPNVITTNLPRTNDIQLAPYAVLRALLFLCNKYYIFQFYFRSKQTYKIHNHFFQMGNRCNFLPRYINVHHDQYSKKYYYI